MNLRYLSSFHSEKGTEIVRVCYFGGLLGAITSRSALILDCNMKVLQHYLNEDKGEILTCCTFLYDDNLYFAVGGNTQIKVINLMEMKYEYILDGHGGKIRKIMQSNRDRNILFSCSEDSTIRMWDLKLRRTIAIFGGIGGHGDIVLSMDQSLCGNLISSSGTDCTIKVWKIPDTDQTQQTLPEENTSSEDIVILSCKKNNETFHKKKSAKESSQKIFTPKSSNPKNPTHKIFYPIYSSSKIHKTYIMDIKFYGTFLISQSLKKIRIVLPDYFTEIYSQKICSDSTFIEEYDCENTQSFSLNNDHLFLIEKKYEIAFLKVIDVRTQKTKNIKIKKYENIKDFLCVDDYVFILRKKGIIDKYKLE